MASSWAEWLVGAAAIYGAIGFLFALAFVSVGVRRIDPAAAKAPLGFRLLIFPGVVALWPLLAKRWLSGGAQPPAEINAHRKAARP